MSGDEAHEIRMLVRVLGSSGRIAPADEATRICRFLGESVLPRRITARVAAKHGTHVEDNLEWPRGTTPDEYLESLRAITLDERSGLFLEYSEDDEIGRPISWDECDARGVDRRAAARSW